MAQDATVERARQAAADEVEGIRQELQDTLAAAETEAANVSGGMATQLCTAC
jgi:hypothetical protein